MTQHATGTRQEWLAAYARGLDGLWGAYQWLDRAVLGRDEPGFWWRHHDKYGQR